MKKIWSTILLISVMSLIACGQGGPKPGTIMLDNMKLSIGDTVVPEAFEIEDVEIQFDAEGKISIINIKNPDVETYKNIRVGDSADKVRNTYKYENETPYGMDDEEILLDVGCNSKEEVKLGQGCSVVIFYSIKDNIVYEIELVSGKGERK